MPSAEMLVTVTRVDVATGQVDGRNSSGGMVRVSAQHRAKGVGLPDVGEVWRITRRGSGWALVEQINAAAPASTSSGSLVDPMIVLRQAGLVTGIAIDNSPVLRRWRVHKSRVGSPIHVVALTDRHFTSSLRGTTWADLLQESLRTEGGGGFTLLGATHASVGTPTIDYLPSPALNFAIGRWGSRGEVMAFGATSAGGAITMPIPAGVDEIEVSMFITGSPVSVGTRINTATLLTNTSVAASNSLVRARVAVGAGANNLVVRATSPGPGALVEVESVRFYRGDRIDGTWVDAFGQGDANTHGFAMQDNPIWAGDSITRATLSLLVLGSRDAVDGSSVDLFESDLMILLERMADLGTLIVVVVPPRPWQVDQATWDEFRDAMYRCAKTFGVGLIDIETVWPEYSAQASGLRNGTELTDYGHRFVADFISDHLSAVGR